MPVPRAPKHLNGRARDLWKSIVNEFELTAIDLELLRRACEAATRADQAAAVLASDGIMVQGRDGSKAHPAIQIELTNRRAETALLEKLHLDDGSSPPSKMQAARDLARARWKAP